MTIQSYEEQDAETIVVHGETLGGPVDPPAEPRTIYADVVNASTQPLRPIVPAWMRSREQRRQVARTGASLAAYHATYHATRTPKYAAKTAVWSPYGVLRAIVNLWKWTFDLEGFGIRQDAASRNNVADYLGLSRQRDRRVVNRLWFTLPLLTAVSVGVVLLCTVAPFWSRVVALAALIPVFAVYGRPADRPITDRVTIGDRFTRLTGEMVRAAIVALGMSRIKDPADIKFTGVGIHRDGPGWLARFNLPAGVEAIKVIEQRGALSSALRLPVDQVWPSVGPAHAGQVDLWVGMVPTSKMPAPRWALTSSTATVSVFNGYPIGHDERLRPVSFTPFERNLLIGGQPGAGKTAAGRAVVLGALLDPLVEMWLAAYKAAEDFYDVSAFCSRYICGIDEQAMSDGAAMVAAGLREVQRRQTYLGKLKREGRITEGRVNPELASAGIGLHPLFIVIDEAHEILGDKDVAADIIRLVKQGRSAFVFLLFITQVAGAGAVPPELTRVTSSRWCLSVADQIANDQIMGTGAYKRGLSGTAYQPGVDQGWGVTMGVQDGYQGAVRAYYPTGDALKTILARIAAVRGAGSYVTDTEAGPRRDILADVLHVFADASRRRLHASAVAERLGAAFPEAYAGLSQEVLSATMRDLGVPAEQVKVDDVNRAGFKIEAVREAYGRRAIGSGEGSGSD